MPTWGGVRKILRSFLIVSQNPNEGTHFDFSTAFEPRKDA